MRWTASTILLSLGYVACGSAVSEPQPLRIEPGQSISLRPGQVALAADGGLRFGFEAVTSDSRCPKNVQCVWAGDATVRIWVQRGAGAREVRDLHVATGSTREPPDPGVRLVRLDPVPFAGKTLEPRDYVATLALAPAAVER